MTFVKRYKKSLSILTVVSIILQIIAVPQVMAHNPEHSGQLWPPGPPVPPPPPPPPPLPPWCHPICDLATGRTIIVCEPRPTAGEPVYLFTGRFYYRHTDLRIPGRIPITITRAYDTTLSYNGPFGYGWTMSYNMRIFRVQDGTLLLRRGDCSRDTFTPNGDNTYSSPPGRYETITLNEDGTFILKGPSDYAHQFDINGCLSSIDGTNGNQLFFTYDPAGKLPIIGISPYSTITTPIVIGYDYRLTRIEEAFDGVLSGRFVELIYNDNGRVIKIMDFSGREISYTYNEAGKGDLVSFKDAEGNLYDYVYENHLMTEFVGLGCNECTKHVNLYDEQNRVVKQMHGNNIIEFDYVEPGQKTKVTTYIYDDTHLELLNTRNEYYQFNSNGYVTKHTIQMGNELDTEGSETDDIVTSYTYNSLNRVTQKTGPRGDVTTYTHDDMRGFVLSEVITLSDETVITKAYTYHPTYAHYTSEEISSSVDSQIFRRKFAYDTNGNLLSETIYADLNDLNTAMVTSYTYNEYGDVLTVTDPMGHVAAREYNECGFLARAYDPNNPSRQTLYVYDNLGNILSTTDARGNTTTFEHDNLNRLIKTTDPLGNHTIYTYSGANLVQVEHGKTNSLRGQITIYEYDGLNRNTAIKMKNDHGIEVTLLRYTHNSEGQILSVTEGNYNTTTNYYDSLGRLSLVSDPSGFTTTFVYDKSTNVISKTDAESNSTYYSYDYDNRLTDVIDALGNKTSYTYNALRNILTVTDPNNNITTHTYDGAGRLVNVVDPGGHTTLYGYDKNGNIIEKITPNEYNEPAGADPIVYFYDQYNQLTNVNYPDGKAVTFTYDDAGNMSAWDDGHLSGLTFHDELNRPERVTTNYPGFTKAVSYTYNRFGQRQTMTDGEGQITSYTYDAPGRLTSIIHPDEHITQYVYDNSSRLKRKILPNGVYTNYTYDPSGHLLSLVNRKPDYTVISSFTYTYDKVGNCTTMTTLNGMHTYSYDDTYQLIAADHPEGFGFVDEFYKYDPVGNRLSSTEYDDWEYDNSNRLLSYDGVSFSYDKNGNTISKTDASGTTSYTYDCENQIVSVITPSHNATYIYDPVGKRLGKVINADIVYFLYDDDDIVAEYDDSGALLKTYYHGLGVDEPVAMLSGNKTYYYAFDGLGSTSQLVDGSGNVIENYDYSAFGRMTSLPERDNSYTYTAREYDAEVKLYYYRSRYLDSATGRFLTRDLKHVDVATISFKENRLPILPGGFYKQPHQYVYVANNPVNLIDPTGEDPVVIITIAGIVITVIGIARCLLAVNNAVRCCHEVTEPRLPECPTVDDMFIYDQKFDMWRGRCVQHCLSRIPIPCLLFAPGL